MAPPYTYLSEPEVLESSASIRPPDMLYRSKFILAQRLPIRPYTSSFSLFPKAFSVLNRPRPNYDGHVPLTRTEKAFLGIGSAFGAFLDPRRAG